MCYMVTLGVKKQNRGVVVEALETAGLSVHPGPLTSPFANADETIMVSHGGCGCGLVAIGEGPITPTKVRARFKKKGWSEQKLSRAVDAVLSKPASGPSKEVRGFAEAVVRGCANRGSVWILVEWWESQASDSRPSSGATLIPEEFLALQGNYPVGQVLRVSRSAR
jgi:hypothetical protein